MYAPIIIPTLNRYEHLVRCIESLKRNPLAKDTELYISLDYPPSEKYIEGYKKVKYYLENELENGFKNVYKYYQTKNLGPINNIYFLRKEIYKKYDCYIYTEDDNEFSTNFLEYMNKGLELYRNNDDVMAICGYRDSEPWDYGDGNAMKVSLFHAWGYATWKDKIDKCHEWICRRNFVDLLKNKNFIQNLYRTRYKSYFTLIEALLANPDDKSNVYINLNGDIEEIDYTIGLYMIVHNMYSILPKEPKVRNWGFDGSGVHCGKNDEIDPNKVIIDMQSGFEYALSSEAVENDNNNKLLKDESFKKNAKIYRRYEMVMHVMGIRVARKIYNLVYLIKSQYFKQNNGKD